jgi:hypothetical protein
MSRRDNAPFTHLADRHPCHVPLIYTPAAAEPIHGGKEHSLCEGLRLTCLLAWDQTLGIGLDMG